MAASSSSSYWCYSCSRFVRVSPHSLSCPDCHTGFLEAVPSPPSSLRRHNHRRSADRFNPLILLRGGARRPGNLTPLSPSTATATFDLYYDDGSGSGLRPLPSSMSEFLMGSGFEQLLHHLSHINSAAAAAAAGGFGSGARKVPASKSSVESMPTVEISDRHVSSDSHCAVCTEPFVVGAGAREMPCKHMYHPECILPWLAVRNSCPVCRHEMPADEGPPDEEAAVGLTVWRLPGGGYAVGRFSGSGGPGRELPVLPLVFTEMDGAFNAAGTGPRRVAWAAGTAGGRRERSGGLRRFFRSFASLFGRRGE